MRRVGILFILIAAAVVLLVTASSSRDAEANNPSNPPITWVPLLNCPNVDGSTNNKVLVADIVRVVQSFGADYDDPEEDYLYLHDLMADGRIRVSDISLIVSAFNDECPLMETQVARATLAMIGEYGGPDYREGYTVGLGIDQFFQSTQYVSGMGIHMYSIGNQTNFPDLDDQLLHPVGLLFNESKPGNDTPGELLGAWYIIPNVEVCTKLGMSNPQSCEDGDIEPVGFGLTNDDEDNQDVNQVQQGFHRHINLCGGNWGTTSSFTLDLPDSGGYNEADCLNGNYLPCGGSGCFWFDNYGWMVHLYNFIPGTDGRFVNFTTNLY